MPKARIVAPKPVKKDVSGYRTPEQIIFREEFERELGPIRNGVNLSLTIAMGVTIAFFLGFIAMVIAYFQILQTSINEFHESKEKYNEDYYQLLEKRVATLEGMIGATSSAERK